MKTATAHVATAAAIGYDGALVDIECDSSNSLPGITIVGLGNKAIDEAKERIRSAITNSNLVMPPKRITLNLAPADLPKVGSGYDLPLAIAILVTSRQIPAAAIESSLIVGELGLDGSIRPSNAILSQLQTAKRAGLSKAIVPEANTQQARLVDGMEIFAATSLRQLYDHLTGLIPIKPLSPLNQVPQSSTAEVDFADVAMQHQAKRALEIAAAGAHNVLMHGPPGTGKTLLAKALISILPSLSKDEIFAVTKLHSLAGESNTIKTTRPFRSPHHSSSHIALVGGGRIPRPGEVSLAHHGVLFMDELPEYTRQSLETLRQPLEDRLVTVARADSSVTFPADFMLVATQNPCPCGYFGDQKKVCKCAPAQLLKYQTKISGPLLDRIDLVVHVDRLPHDRLLKPSGEEPSQQIRSRVEAARSLQAQRLGDNRTNSSLNNKELKSKINLTPEAKSLLDKAAGSLNLSPRAYMRCLRVARTIADLNGEIDLTPDHIGEALQYRKKDAIA